MDAKGRESEPACIDDEIPFEIPDGWEWARLGALASFGGGGTPDKGNPSFWNGDIPWASMKDVHGSRLEGTIDSITEAGLKSKASISICQPGQIIVSTRLIPGKTILSCIRCAINQDLKVVHTTLPVDYLVVWFNSHLAEFKRIGSGTTVPGIKLADLENALVPVPPLVEQRRVAKRVSELMPLVEEYGRLEDEREALDAALPDRLRKSVLQMAVEGKLAPQDSSDEPASALLERIREERAKLIKEKKIKAPKGGESVIYLDSDGRRYEKRVDAKGRESEPVCIDDEIPFEIPEGWEWARLGTFFTKIGSGSTPAGGRQVYKNEGPMLIRSQNVHNDGLCLSNVAHFDYSLFERRSTHVAPNDILLNITGASIGRCAIVPGKIGDADVNQHVLIMRPIQPETNAFIHKAILSELVQSQIMGNQVGATKEGLSAAKASSLLVPVPSLAEQRRIVAQVNSILVNIR